MNQENAVKKLVNEAKEVVIIQADNPDGDSLASSLALEAILSKKNKKITMYCGVDIPNYLRYMLGWDRVVKELPKNFDLSIIVDTSSLSLLETLDKSEELAQIKAKPCVIIDHHDTEPTIDFTEAIYCPKAVSTGEAIFQLYGDNLDKHSSELIVQSILSDSLGLTSESVTSNTFKVMSELVNNGASIARLEDQRRKLNKKSQRILKYKSELLSRVQFSDSGQIASIVIPWEEIEEYSHEYNPSMLVLDEMRMVEKVLIAIAYKTYPDGKVTGKIRTNFGVKVANKIAEKFGGGGHEYAAGFKIESGKDVNQIKKEAEKVANELIEQYDINSDDETIQYTF